MTALRVPAIFSWIIFLQISQPRGSGEHKPCREGAEPCPAQAVPHWPPLQLSCSLEEAGWSHAVTPALLPEAIFNKVLFVHDVFFTLGDARIAEPQHSKGWNSPKRSSCSPALPSPALTPGATSTHSGTYFWDRDLQNMYKNAQFKITQAAALPNKSHSQTPLISARFWLNSSLCSVSNLSSKEHLKYFKEHFLSACLHYSLVHTPCFSLQRWNWYWVSRLSKIPFVHPKQIGQWERWVIY